MNTSSKYIWHITLQTGHSRATYRSEISDEVIEELAPLIAQDGEMPIKRIPGRSLKCTRTGKMLLATVMAREAPICTIGVAGQSRGAATLWHMLHNADMVGNSAGHTNLADVPHAPWCAARLEPSITRYSQDTQWLGDFERCLAWTWVEKYC